MKFKIIQVIKDQAFIGIKVILGICFQIFLILKIVAAILEEDGNPW